LKKENDDLKLEVSSLKSDLKNLEASIERRITQSNVQHGDRSTRPDNETKKSLEFLSNSYDDLSNFRKTAKIEFERLDKRLDCLEAKVDGITNAIDNLECYSYQYNAKLVSIPELKAMESSLETSKLCVQLFKEMGACCRHNVGRH
jgi:chromosome segregation ATPase